jgi:hypothetical protein
VLARWFISTDSQKQDFRNQQRFKSPVFLRMTFLPNAVLRIAFTISAPGLDYGKMTFFKFARKCQSSVTGNPAPFFRTPL